MTSVYLETSFVSACVTTRSDPGSMYRRETSVDWMKRFGDSYDIAISAEVLAELSSPDYPSREAALSLVERLSLLAIDDRVRGFARLLVRERVMPGPESGDAMHVAVACVHGVDFVLSWNVRHLANPNKLRHLQAIAMRVGLLPPRIVTPDLLWELPS